MQQKDIDLVLIIEAVDAAFGRKFWDYVKQAGYEHRNKKLWYAAVLSVQSPDFKPLSSNDRTVH